MKWAKIIPLRTRAIKATKVARCTLYVRNRAISLANVGTLVGLRSNQVALPWR